MSKPDLSTFSFAVDLEQGVVPISKAASSLAALLKRTRTTHKPIIITQKGYPTGVLLDIELFTTLRELASRHRHSGKGEAGEQGSSS